LEILLYIIAFLIGVSAIFFIIEYPYHFVGFFIFIIYYQFNVELPGPLDLRGWLTIILFFRLIVFDKENLSIIVKELFSNYIFIYLFLFELFFVVLTYGVTNAYKLPIRLFIFQMIGLVLGFLAVYRGYIKQTFYATLILTGILATIDLTYSFAVTSKLFVRRVLDVLIKTEYSTDLNHNYFGVLNGIALVTVYIMLVSKQIKTKWALILILIYGTGLLLSTSRGTLVTVAAALIVGTLLLPRDQVDVKKIFKFGISGVTFGIIILSSYIFILSSLNVDSEFTDKVYYRLVEEPIALLEGKTSSFRGDSQTLKEGSMSWRLKKALRDFNEFAKLNFSRQLIGFGYRGYYEIGEKSYDPWGFRYQIASHNGIASIIIERGIIGLILFFTLNIIIIRSQLKTFKNDISVFPFFVIIIFMLINTFGASSLLLSRFGFILMGGIIGQSLYQKYQSDDNEIDYN
jgi:hypothetical protein